jgi:hypothetical protein
MNFLDNSSDIISEFELNLFGLLYRIIWKEETAQEIYKGANEDYLFNNRSTITELINEKIS